MLFLAVGKHMCLQLLSFCPNVINKQLKFSVRRGRLHLIFHLLFFLLFFSLSLLLLSFFLSLSPPAWNMEVELAVDFFLLLLGLVSGSLSSLSDLVTGADAYRIQSTNVTITLLVINILQNTVNKHALYYTTSIFLIVYLFTYVFVCVLD